MEPKIQNFLCFKLASAIPVGESYLDHFRLSLLLKGAVAAKDLPQFCFSEEEFRFHVKLSMGRFVHFQHEFHHSCAQINIWEE